MIIVDTGFFVAIQSQADRDHKHAVDVLERIDEPFITTLAVVTETCHLLQRSFGWIGSQRFVHSLDQGLATLDQFDEDDLEKAAKVMRKYRDLPCDFADASLVLLAEKLGHGRILSTDLRDFKCYRWKNTKPFENLLVR